MDQIIATCLNHISEIQRHIDGIDNYILHTPLNEQQKKTCIIRKKIYTDFLQAAVDLYNQLKLEKNKITVCNSDILNKINLLRETRATALDFETYKAARKNNNLYLLKGYPSDINKSIVMMDFNKFGIL